VYKYIYIYIHIYIYTYTYIYTYILTYVRTHKCTYAYIYIYIYICTYTQPYIYTYIHAYVPNKPVYIHQPRPIQRIEHLSNMLIRLKPFDDDDVYLNKLQQNVLQNLWSEYMNNVDKPTWQNKIKISMQIIEATHLAEQPCSYSDKRLLYIYICISYIYIYIYIYICMYIICIYIYIYICASIYIYAFIYIYICKITF
jgi:hypothetical protein